MPLSLPPEILDLIVDHLRDEPTTLKICCTVSKSRVPRARKHLFIDVSLHTQGSFESAASWTKAFPDPSNSPARHTRTWSSGRHRCRHECWWLGVHASRHVVTLNVEVFGWCDDSRVSFVPLHGISPTLKSLRVTCHSTPLSEVFDLICSFPLLEDLVLRSHVGGDTDGWNAPSTSPRFTGSLCLRSESVIQSVVRQVVSTSPRSQCGVSTKPQSRRRI